MQPYSTIHHTAHTAPLRQRREAPEGFRQAPPPLVPMPISHFLVRPRRAAAVRTNAAIDASLRGDNVRR